MTPEQRAHLLRLVAATPCAFCAEDEDDCGYGLDAICAFVSQLTAPPWTSEVPRVAGDYRWRASRNVKAILLRVAHLGDRLHAYHGRDTQGNVAGIGGQWSGPLPEPGEE